MPKKAKITTRDIAARCGISQTTVSMILSEKEGVRFSKETVETVKSTAEKMGYKYKRRGVRETNLAQNTIMILVPSLSSQYYTTIISAVTEYATKKNLDISVGITLREKKREEYYLRLCIQSDFFGVICTYPPKAVDAINAYYKKHPFVLMSDYNPELKVGLVELDSYKSGEIVGEHLLQLGHKKLAYVTTPLNPNEYPRLRRLEGMKHVYERAGLPDAVLTLSLTDYQWQNYCTGNRYYDCGSLLVQEYLKQPCGVTAFVANNDIIAIGVMDCLQKHGYHIPQDFSVCGFDNTLPSAFYSISLTTIDHCVEEKGKVAVDMLRSQKEHLSGIRDEKKSPVLRISYEPQLFVRNSTGPAANQSK